MSFDDADEVAPVRSRRARWILAVLVVLALLALFVRPKPEPATPATWDPRVTDLVAVVERERGLTFEHPVRLEFLHDSAFDLRIRSETARAAAPDGIGGTYAALGLADDYDATAADAQSESLVLGYYDPASDSIVVRGNELTSDLRAVLVHELTHALQAQHFDLSAAIPGSTALAVVEADALRIERRYVESLPATDQTVVEAATTLNEAEVAALDALPWTIAESLYAPYVLGPSFLEIVEAAGGNAAVDDALRRPPAEENLLDPWQYLEPSTVRATGPVRATGTPEARIVEGPRPFGLVEAIVLFDTWLPWQETRRALDGWRAAQLIATRSADGDADARACVTIAIRVDGADAADRLEAAVRDWAIASGSDAVPTRGPGEQGYPDVTFSSCRTAADGAPPVPPLPRITPTIALAFENQFVSEVLAENPDADRRIARCTARLLVDEPGFQSLFGLDEITDDQWDQFFALREDREAACASDPTLLPDV